MKCHPMCYAVSRNSPCRCGTRDRPDATIAYLAAAGTVGRRLRGAVGQPAGIAGLVQDGDGRSRLARCRVAGNRCDTHKDIPPSGSPLEFCILGTLDAWLGSAFALPATVSGGGTL